MFIVSLILQYLGITLANSAYDSYLILKKNVNIDHGKNLLIYAVVIVVVTLINWVIRKPEINEVLATLITVPALRWCVHDFSLNWARGLKQDYIDREDAAFTDQILGFFKDHFDLHPWITRLLTLASILVISLLIHKFL